MSSFDANEIVTQTWHHFCKREFKKKYFLELQKKIFADAGPVYPPRNLIFNAFNLCSWSKIKVVIIGQDPYHNPGQAMGLAFSHPREIGLPPHSCLRNIYRELMSDPKIKMPQMPTHGDLTNWAQQGVFLLNSTLTVKHKTVGSHSDYGWHTFTDNAIKLLNRREHLVFLLWGAHAQSKADLIDSKKHLILQTSHPSGLSCNRGFLGCGHFGKCNEYLTSHRQTIIDWVSVLNEPNSLSA